ncbi:hypothetical protein [Oscillibacter sp.]|uniref:hypothetical protein n=1 Tax=Oscillibacter sp. TaxID=1945593 RepID=UPI0025898E9A|nr:hypothetical protein [Oscillibacter sp.]
MAWLQVHQTLKDHRKLFDAADELEIQPVHMMGLLISFWMWALDNAPTGDLDGITPRMIARAAQWDGPAEKLSTALIRAGWLDEDGDSGKLMIHDWYEYTGKLIDQRQAEKERSQRRRAAAAASANGNTDDQQTTAGQPPDGRKKARGRVDQSRPDQTREGKDPPPPSAEGETAGKSAIEVRFAEFWSAYPKKVAKQYALKAWKRLKPDADLHDKIMRAVEAQKRSEQWRRDNGRYIPNPTTWLNGGQWDNETEEVRSDAEDRRDTQQHDAGGTGKDWTKGFKPADDTGDE